MSRRAGAWAALAAALLWPPACSRVTGLPQVPDDLTATATGLADLERATGEAARLGRAVTDADAARFASGPPATALDRARWALHRIEAGEGEAGLALMRAALEADPASLVVGNAYRMAVYRLKRRALAERKRAGELAPRLPDYLAREPLETLEALAARAPGPQIELQAALAYVDRMVLNPALEIKAPASIDSTRVLTALLDRHPYYVPALYARGLNYLFRPRNLVWPENPRPPRDAGSIDLGRAAAAAAQVGGAPPRLRALVLMTLGDAYAHQERMDQARSWWMLARAGADDETARELAVRFAWGDAEGPDLLEARLDERMAQQDRPLSDLSFLWSPEETS